MKISDIMTRNVQVADPQQSIREEIGRAHV